MGSALCKLLSAVLGEVKAPIGLEVLGGRPARFANCLGLVFALAGPKVRLLAVELTEKRCTARAVRGEHPIGLSKTGWLSLSKADSASQVHQGERILKAAGELGFLRLELVKASTVIALLIPPEWPERRARSRLGFSDLQASGVL